MTNFRYEPWLTSVIGKASYLMICDEQWRRDIAANRTSEARQFMEALTTPIFIHCKVATTDIASIYFIEKLGFHLIDTNVTFSKPITPTAKSIGHQIRIAEPSDQEAVVALAAGNFEYSRFHLDPSLDSTTANAIKGEWTRNYFFGQRGDQMLVAEYAGNIVGYIFIDL